ncbi:MAG: hypothetical protein QM500_10820 [Methylococcales bacterium]
MAKIKKNQATMQAQDKTDWKKIYNQTQATADRKAGEDTENPVMKNAKFKRLNDKK